MGGCRCSYKNCERASHNSDKNFHFFRYPTKDYARTLKWMANAGKPAFLDLAGTQLRNKVICQNHFEMNFFTNSSKKRLTRGAIPTLDVGCTNKRETVDVKVLETSRNCTVFTVDTESINALEGNKVTSFVITNGDVVLAYPQEDPKAITDEFDNEKDVIEIPHETHVYNVPESNNKHSNDPEVDNSSVENNRNSSFIYPPPPLVPAPIISSTPIPLRTTSSLKEITTSIPTPTPEKKLKRKLRSDLSSIVDIIEKHTREIAKLKRVLQARKRKIKHRKIDLLNQLRPLIPCSLYGAVSLHMFRKKDNFTHIEQNLLTKLYQSPPTVIDVLNNKLKWKLPNSDRIRNIVLNQNQQT